MQQALGLARKALGKVSPNPAVGAVLVKDGIVIGQGFTQAPGEDHAEIVALQVAGEAARGATLYVTLEPCAHHGRTPPCVDAIVDAGVAEVCLATMDPNPKTDGKGKAALEAGGVQVLVGDGAEQALEVNETFAKHVTTGEPFVVAKFAMSLDGKIATATGESRWITGVMARREAHRLRAEYDAVMVGIGTALADDPRLTVRDVDLPPLHQPLRVVVDSRGRLPVEAVMLEEDGQTLVAVAGVLPVMLQAAGAEVVRLPSNDGRVDLPSLLGLLGERGITSVLVEGGSQLLGSFFDLGLVDKVVAFVAPVVIGGAGAPAPIGGAGAFNLADALRLHSVRYEVVGNDMMVVGYPRGD
jgi:diaminohydroxyphosphoribosylaminopyrimidine deaminase/5-amino-6-(5-phosphoribosylamino)uracil reductase